MKSREKPVFHYIPLPGLPGLGQKHYFFIEKREIGDRRNNLAEELYILAERPILTS